MDKKILDKMFGLYNATDILFMDMKDEWEMQAKKHLRELLDILFEHKEVLDNSSSVPHYQMEHSHLLSFNNEDVFVDAVFRGTDGNDYILTGSFPDGDEIKEYSISDMVSKANIDFLLTVFRQILSEIDRKHII